MKSPDEIKKGLECCANTKTCANYTCPYYGSYDISKCIQHLCDDSVTYINQLESTYSQVSKALCGKENATSDEVLREVSQLKSRLAQAERERAVLMWDARGCHSCKHIKNGLDKPPCDECTDEGTGWEWRGLCEENSR